MLFRRFPSAQHKLRRARHVLHLRCVPFLGVAAEHAHAADRFARKIVGFLKVIGGALAAADGQAVGRLPFRKRVSFFRAAVWCCGSRMPCCSDETNRAWDERPWCYVWFHSALSQSWCIRGPVVLGVVPSAWFDQAQLLVSCARTCHMPHLGPISALPPNTPLELTPLRGPEIGAILNAGIGRLPSRSIGAAQLSGNPLARRHNLCANYKALSASHHQSHNAAPVHTA